MHPVQDEPEECNETPPHSEESALDSEDPVGLIFQRRLGQSSRVVNRLDPQAGLSERFRHASQGHRRLQLGPARRSLVFVRCVNQYRFLTDDVLGSQACRFCHILSLEATQECSSDSPAKEHAEASSGLPPGNSSEYVCCVLVFLGGARSRS